MHAAPDERSTPAGHLVPADGHVVTNRLGAMVIIPILVLRRLGLALLSLRPISLFPPPRHSNDRHRPARKPHRYGRFRRNATTAGMAASLRAIERGGGQALAGAGIAAMEAPSLVLAALAAALRLARPARAALPITRESREISPIVGSCQIA